MIPWLIAIPAALVWIGGWIALGSRHTATKDGDALAEVFGKLLPAATVTTLLIVFGLVRVRASLLYELALWLHHTSIVLLFLFLISAQYLQTEAWWKIRGGAGAQSVASTYRRLWTLTAIVPAPVAMAIWLTGLRLIWESPQANAPSQLWLTVLIVGFSFFFWDGIFGYTPIVRKLWHSWEYSARDDASLVERPRVSRGDTVQLFAHFLSWPVLFVFGVFRWDNATVLTQYVARLENSLRYLSAGWPEVATAVILWALAGVLVVLTRLSFRF